MFDARNDEKQIPHPQFGQNASELGPHPIAQARWRPRFGMTTREEMSAARGDGSERFCGDPHRIAADDNGTKRAASARRELRIGSPQNNGNTTCGAIQTKAPAFTVCGKKGDFPAEFVRRKLFADTFRFSGAVIRARFQS